MPFSPSPDPSTPPRPGPWQAAFVLLAVSTLLGLVEATQVQFDRALQGDPIRWPHALVHGLPRWYSWALLVPVVFRVTRAAEGLRLRSRTGPASRGEATPGHRRALAGMLAVHVAAALAITVVQVGMYASVSTLLHGEADPWSHLRPKFETYLGLTYLGGLVTYALLVSSWYGWTLLARLRERERLGAAADLQAAELERLLATARLHHLQSRLQPHFLFNALHAISGMVSRGDSRRAVRLTARLSELLRRVLRASESTEVALGDELRLLESYLEVQRLRFPDRLQVSVDVEPGLEHARVPTLVLQPLVENAILHGLEVDPSAGRIRVRVRSGDGVEGTAPGLQQLVLEVEDDGPGPPADRVAAPETRGEGVGLGVTRQRLAGLYGEDASLQLRSGPSGGTLVTLRIPLRNPSTAPDTRDLAREAR